MTLLMRDTDGTGEGSVKGTGGSDAAMGRGRDRGIGNECWTVSSTRVTIAPHFATNAFPNSDKTRR